MLLRWQTLIETPAGFWEIPAEALVYATDCGLLKQPDKQEATRRKSFTSKGEEKSSLRGIPVAQ